jgi:DHA2 family multidrug resistance protein
MPLAGLALGKFPARNLIAGGFAGFALAFYYSSTHITLGISFAFSTWLRIVQMAPIPFCFIAITTAAYVGLPKEATDQVSGIINFARNVGGSVFISVTGAIVTNRSLFHQARLADNLQMGNPVLANRLNALTNAYSGVSGGQGAAAMAQGQIYNQLNAAGFRDGISGHLPNALLGGGRNDHRFFRAEQKRSQRESAGSRLSPLSRS